MEVKEILIKNKDTFELMKKGIFPSEEIIEKIRNTFNKFDDIRIICVMRQSVYGREWAIKNSVYSTVSRSLGTIDSMLNIIRKHQSIPPKMVKYLNEKRTEALSLLEQKIDKPQSKNSLGFLPYIYSSELKRSSHLLILTSILNSNLCFGNWSKIVI